MIVAATEVSKRFGATIALHRASFVLQPASTTLLIGANGSGKSTLVRIVAGLSTPDSGTVTYASPRPSIGYAGHALLLYGQLSVAENLRFFAKLKGEDNSVSDVLAQWKLTEHRHKQLRELSKGLAARLSLARCFLGAPKLILLDEPSSHLDDSGVEILKEHLAAAQASGAAVCIVSHDLTRWVSFATTLELIARGSLIGRAAVTEDTQVAEIVRRYREGNR